MSTREIAKRRITFREELYLAVVACVLESYILASVSSVALRFPPRAKFIATFMNPAIRELSVGNLMGISVHYNAS